MTENEKFTFYFCSNDLDQTRSVELPLTTIKTVLLAAIIASFLSISILFDYFHLRSCLTQFVQVKKENKALIVHLQYVESELNSLESQLAKVEELTDKIEIIKEHFNQVPISSVNVTTDYFSNDSVSNEGHSRGPSSLMGSAEPALLTETHREASKPILNQELVQEEFFIDKMSDRIEVAVDNTQVLERKVMNLWENISERQNFLRATPSIRPAKGWFSSRFGVRADPYTGRPTMHSGLDIAGPWGTPVVAPADGIVAFVGYQNGYGKVLAIDHGYGLQTRFAHNSNIFVKLGQKIRRYDLISAVGSSGRSTGPHVHYEVRVRGIAVDPINYVLDF